MAYQYQYDLLNVGQYPEAAQERMDAMTADGWHIHTCLPNYSEVAIMWERTAPGDSESDDGEEGQENLSKGRSRAKAGASA